MQYLVDGACLIVFVLEILRIFQIIWTIIVDMPFIAHSEF